MFSSLIVYFLSYMIPPLICCYVIDAPKTRCRDGYRILCELIVLKNNLVLLPVQFSSEAMSLLVKGEEVSDIWNYIKHFFDQLTSTVMCRIHKKVIYVTFSRLVFIPLLIFITSWLLSYQIICYYEFYVVMCVDSVNLVSLEVTLRPNNLNVEYRLLNAVNWKSPRMVY